MCNSPDDAVRAKLADVYLYRCTVCCDASTEIFCVAENSSAARDIARQHIDEVIADVHEHYYVEEVREIKSSDHLCHGDVAEVPYTNTKLDTESLPPDFTVQDFLAAKQALADEQRMDAEAAARRIPLPF